jgi:dephospho-CoA kinase
MNQQNTEVQPKVVGIVGLNGSGKDAFLKYLKERCGLEILSLGDVARELAHLEGVKFTRDKLHEISQKYVEKYGQDFFIKVLIEEISKKSMEKVGVTGIRTPTDITLLKQRYGADFFLVHVEVGNPELRFERLKQRGETRDPHSYEKFLAQERSEKEMFQIEEAIAQADVTVRNDGTLEDFHREIDQLIEQQQFFQDLGCRT